MDVYLFYEYWWKSKETFNFSNISCLIVRFITFFIFVPFYSLPSELVNNLVAFLCSYWFTYHFLSLLRVLLSLIFTPVLLRIFSFLMLSQLNQEYCDYPCTLDQQDTLSSIKRMLVISNTFSEKQSCVL